jgi:hypothetical protein
MYWVDKVLLYTVLYTVLFTVLFTVLVTVLFARTLLILNSYSTPTLLLLDKDVFAYLTRCDSIPAFLSTVTTTLFDRQTVCFR